MARLPNLIFLRPFIQISANSIKRSLMTTPTRVQKALEDLSKNAYFEKYAEKIAKLQKTSPEEFLSRVDHLEKKTPKPKPQQVTEGKFSQLLNPKKPLDQAEPSESPLDKIMKIDLIKDKTSAEIKDIWREYHLRKNFIAAVMPADDYQELEAKGKQYPTFLFPLPRSQGYEFMMLQFNKNCVHFTPLLYYQVHKENAPECLTITHYTEFKDAKKIVLMRGEYDKNVIDLKEAQCLANQLLLYYVRPSADKVKLLERFTQKPDEFKHTELIKQIENLSM